MHIGNSDAAAERHLANVLIQRRDAIGRAYLSAINPVVNPRLSTDGALVFDNAAVDAGFAKPATAYGPAWLQFDSATGNTTKIADRAARRRSCMRRRPAPGAIGSLSKSISARRATIHRGSSPCARIAARRMAGSSSARAAARPAASGTNKARGPR